jgi:phospholipase C
VSQILDALTANPEVWAKTVFLVTYDENDGFFDHVPPPTVPVSRAQGLSTVSTANEIFPGSAEYPTGPYGMGVRVPMLVISPWSKGGYVNSQVFDHTSIIRFLEQRFGAGKAGLEEANITPWRRAVAGDLTSAFNFATPNDSTVPLPSTVAYMPPDNQRHPDYVPVPPAVQALPQQETGVRPARAVPYALDVRAAVEPAKAEVALRFANSGAAAAVFQVRAGSGGAGPWTYTVGAGAEASDSLAFTGAYDLSVYGPNGFYRRFKGGMVEETFGVAHRGERPLSVAKVPLEIEVGYDLEHNGVMLMLQNKGTAVCPISIRDGYTKKVLQEIVMPGSSVSLYFSLAKSYGWYDLLVESKLDAAFQRHVAGHVETGKDSMTDPAIGG